MRYTININHFKEGGSAEFYSFKNCKDKGFKQFKNKKWADNAYETQKKLSRLGLAPKVYGKVRKLSFTFKCCGETIKEYTNWGYVTEKAEIFKETASKNKLVELQKLVDSIESKSGLKFWDCHYYNVGYIKRKNSKKLVCIDTGKESFYRDCNAWGFCKPGPKCDSCNKFSCRCSVYS